ncbi:ABC_ATPase domain containing protein [uncultured Caudovirales phage]|uniref:ABC_ATPase domain containing protein n=1 Tax=uncultured Caudovirales phage TaxID=2100421 RepID=A0A6J7WST5_9CAUD|nr:ABC_ATPase domain containing protein [uncultured Caudovirales phage]
MKLTLTKIRQHKNLSISVSGNGLVRVKGPSGAGKTTVFDAIRHALYGDLSGLTHWDESSSSIDLEFLGLKIRRTMRPNALWLEKNSTNYVDDEAQAEIIKTMQMTSEEFIASSYIQQEFAESLLTLAAADQLRLVQSLAFGDDDPEITKEKIKVEIQNCQLEAKAAEATLIAAKTATEKLAASVDRLSVFEDAEEPSVPDVSVEEQQQKQVQTNIKDVKADISKISEELSHPAIEMTKQLTIRKAEYEAISASQQPIIDSLKERVSKHQGSGTVDELRGEKKKLESEKSFFSAKDLLKEIASKYPQKPKEQKIAEFLAAQISDNKAVAEDLEKSIAAVEEEIANIQRAKKELVCPACDAPLSYRSGVLHRHDSPVSGVDLGKEDSLKEDLASKRLALKSLKAGLLASLTDDSKEVERLKKSVPGGQPSFKSLQELQERIDQIDEALVIASQAQRDLSSLSIAEATLEKSLRKVESTEKALASYDHIPDATILADRLSISQAELSSLMNTQMELANHIANHAKAVAARTVWESNQSRLAEARTDLEAAKTAEESAQAYCDQVSATYAGYLRLKELSDTAALEAIGEMFNALNLHAKGYVDQLFPDTGTQVLLKNRKELASGGERAKVSLGIFHKGSQVKAFKDLSGGEKGRLKLAFHLALADLYKSPILLIDEPFQGMDEASRELAIDCLENINDNKIVLIIEHNMQDSQADHVIEI